MVELSIMPVTVRIKTFARTYTKIAALHKCVPCSLQELHVSTKQPVWQLLHLQRLRQRAQASLVQLPRSSDGYVDWLIC